MDTSESTRQDLEAAESTTTPDKGARVLAGCLVVILALGIIAVLVVIAFGLRSCENGRAARPSDGSPTSSPETTVSPSTGYSYLGIENEVYAALQPVIVQNGLQVSRLVRIVQVAPSEGGAVVTLRLTGDRFWHYLGTTYPINMPLVVSACEKAVLLGVPEVTRVLVVSENGAVLGAASRP